MPDPTSNGTDPNPQQNGTPADQQAGDLAAQLEALKQEHLSLQSKYETQLQGASQLTQALEDLKKAMGERDGAIVSLQETGKQAVSRYKQALAQANPTLADFIEGDSLDAIDASVTKAKSLAEKLTASIQAQNAAAVVPAGAPERTETIPGDLSPRDKINLGIKPKK